MKTTVQAVVLTAILIISLIAMPLGVAGLDNTGPVINEPDNETQPEATASISDNTSTETDPADSERIDGVTVDEVSSPHTVTNQSETTTATTDSHSESFYVTDTEQLTEAQDHGERLDVTYHIENRGDAAGSQTVTLELGDYQLASEQHSLDAGEQMTGTLSGTIPAEAAGTDVLTITTADHVRYVGSVTVPYGTVHGDVVAADGSPLVATVEIIDASSDERVETLTTSDNGTYEALVPEGQYVLEVDATGYIPQQYPDLGTVNIRPGTIADSTVTLDPRTGTLVGTVTDADGTAIDGATVSASNERTTTDETGAYELPVSPGEHTLVVDAPAFDNSTETVTVDAHEQVTTNVTLQQSYSTLEGTLTDTDGDPIFDAVVSVGDQTAITDEDGTYELTVRSGTHTVEIDAFENRTETVTLEPDETTTLDTTLGTDAPRPATFIVAESTPLITDPDPGTNVDVEVLVENYGSETGTQTVTLELDNETAATEEVTLEGNEQSLLILSVDLPDDATGDQALTVRTDDHEQDTGTVTVPYGTIYGTITDEFGEPLDATVSLRSGTDTKTVQTDADGTYEAIVPRGTYYITIEADGHNSVNLPRKADPYPISPGFELGISRSLDVDSVAIMHSDIYQDERAPGDWVDVGYVVENHQDETTTETLTFELDGTVLETKTVTLEPKAEAGLATLQIPENATGESLLTISTETSEHEAGTIVIDAGTLEGTVTDADGTPLETEVEIRDAETGAVADTVMSDDDGSYKTTVSSGTYEIAAEAVESTESATVEMDETTTVTISS
ncbi:PEGA domain-containing protein [Natronolimnobius sp. AArcel1]|uniref:carboxypeptidase regulatory-like domain-containing protein n=1 Tax=Natronolimnobius sp. AArcel1 TaxID=1679093 RepID=UPI0013EB888F|nr:carboxypeptidase regulatory-like domain-containing protein [Natronolimnobius sp. AArcel1]NGM68004.1 PEGA domain-containing protein [Natronolimnobius sp. AArcel1]